MYDNNSNLSIVHSCILKRLPGLMYLKAMHQILKRSIYDIIEFISFLRFIFLSWRALLSLWSFWIPQSPPETTLNPNAAELVRGRLSSLKLFISLHVFFNFFFYLKSYQKPDLFSFSLGFALCRRLLLVCVFTTWTTRGRSTLGYVPARAHEHTHTRKYKTHRNFTINILEFISFQAVQEGHKLIHNMSQWTCMETY